jgi:cell division transport system permease protein
MSPRAWAIAFRDSIRSMTASPVMALASMATVAVSLLVLSVVLLLAVNLEHMATSVESQVQITAYLCDVNDDNPACNNQPLKDEAKKSVTDQIGKLPGVKQATFITKDQALAKMKEQFGEQKGILEGLDGQNPLRDSVEVQANTPAQVKGIADGVDNIQGISSVTYGKEYVDKLLSFTRAVRIGGVGLVAMLIIATVLTISNTIRLAVYARRREISIMKLVGATDWYIRRPFMLEGVFLGVIGAGLSMALTGYGYQRFVVYAYQNIPFLPVVPAERVLMSLTAALVLLGCVLGTVGSWLSMRRFLKV